MIPQKHRQWMLLTGLLLVLVIVVTYQIRSQDPTTVPQTPSNPAAGGRGAPRATDVPVTGLRLETLQTARGNLPAAERNPFRFRERPAPPAPPPQRGPTPVFAPQAPTGPPPPPPIPLRFIGLIDGSSRIAVLSDGRGDVFYGKDGDIIDGRYRVLRIGPDSADLSYTDGRGRQTLRLSGQ
jgi:hypothetical protein